MTAPLRQESDGGNIQSSPPMPDTARNNRWIIATQLLTLAAVVFLTALDQTVVVTALLPMSNSLGLTSQDLPSLSWVISGYLLGYVIVMPLMGRVADLWGRRKLMLICLVVFAIGSLLCVEAIRLAAWWDLSILKQIGIDVKSPALAWLIFARFIQAVGGGAVVPIALATSGSLFGSDRRSVALGFITGVTEAGGALGPLYGAIILEKWPISWEVYAEHWMWLFLLNLPLVAILVVMLWAWWAPQSEIATLHARRQTTTGSPAVAGEFANELASESDVESTTESRSLDWLGAIVIGAALLCLSLGLSQQAGAMVELSTDQQTANNPYLIGAACVLFLAFIAIERRQKAPLVPLQFFGSRIFSASAMLSLLTGVVLIVALVNVPIFAYAVLSQSHLDAGLLLLRLTVMIPLGAFLSGWLVARMGSRVVGVMASLVIAVGFILMSRWTPDSTQAFLTLGTVVTGFGFGLVLAPVSTTALQPVPKTHFGIAAAISTSMRMIGMIFGLAALSSWEVRRFQQVHAELRAAPRPPGCMFECMAKQLESNVKTATGTAMAETFLAAAVVAGIGIIIALLLGVQKTALGERAGTGPQG